MHAYSAVLSPICEVAPFASAVLNAHASIRAAVGAGAGAGAGFGVGVVVGTDIAATRQCRRSTQTPAYFCKLENDQRRRRGLGS